MFQRSALLVQASFFEKSTYNLPDVENGQPPLTVFSFPGILFFTFSEKKDIVWKGHPEHLVVEQLEFYRINSKRHEPTSGFQPPPWNGYLWLEASLERTV